MIRKTKLNDKKKEEKKLLSAGTVYSSNSKNN